MLKKTLKSFLIEIDSEFSSRIFKETLYLQPPGSLQYPFLLHNLLHNATTKTITKLDKLVF